MADLAKLVVRLEAQSAQLTTELAKANSNIEKFAQRSSRVIAQWAAGIAAGFTVAAGVNIAKQAIDNMDAIGDMAQAAGSSVEEFSAMAYAIKGAGIEAEEFTKLNIKLASSAVDAAKGVKSSSDAWKALGVQVKNSDGSIKSNNQLLLEAADAFSQYADGPEKAALASDIFGDKLAGRLIPFLNKGRQGIEALLQEADDFGQVIGTDAAKAADNFNDNMDRLGAVVSGVVNKAIAEVLPNLEALSTDMVQGAKDSDALDKSVRVLATGIKLLVSAGIVVGEIFDRIGDTIGAVAAAVIKAAQGDFNEAWDIIKDGARQTQESGQQAADELYAVWSDTGTKIADAAVVADEKVKKTLIFGGNTDAVQSVKISAKKIELSAMEQFYQDLDDLTQTTGERAIASYNEQKEALEALYAAGRISLDEYNKRLEESLDEFLPEFNVTVKKITETAASNISEFDKAVAHNTVDIIADALTGGFDDGAKGILRTFANMIRDLTAQALAAELGKKLFGAAGGGSGGGWTDIALNAIGSFFGGGAASGREHVPAGMALTVGENGPERFVAPAAGKVIPAAEMAAAPQVQVPLTVVNVDDPNKVAAYFNSQKGARTFLNLLTDNRSSIRQILQGA